MRNFILFIHRFFNLLLFIALEIVCILLIARTNTLQGIDILSSSNAIVGMVLQKRENVLYYFSLKQMNDSLLKENARLQLQLSENNYSFDELKDSTITQSIPPKDSTDKIRYAQYIYRTARVINNSIEATNNYITLNRGYNHGIQKNMAVISGTGVVGRVMYVSANYSSVLSILNVKQKVSAQLASGTIGSVMWEEGNPDVLIMEDIPQQVTVKIGDSVFTTSYSFFPPHVLIGKVFKKKIIKKNNLQYLYIRSATNFRNLQYAYVVENIKAAEKKTLEDSTTTQKTK
ncbi:MAG TPA: rod shape-determining protein MreC [Flavipsychrobacter sp.]|nr:rod shape-determining protein MreC [Flavipsychrobacter sp.]